MKRNDIFMIAYISFVLISILIRVFFEYTLWVPLVIAITFSSMLFAFEDLFISLEKMTSDMCDITESIISTTRDKVKKAQTFYNKVDEKISILKNLEYSYSILKSSIESCNTHSTELIQRISEVELEVNRDREAQKKFKILASVCAYLGFLILFCLLIFVPLFNISVTAQELFTVFSFFVVLLTNQVRISSSRMIKDRSKDRHKFLQLQGEAEKELSMAEKDFEHLLKRIENLPGKLEEESDHAD